MSLCICVVARQAEARSSSPVPTPSTQTAKTSGSQQELLDILEQVCCQFFHVQWWLLPRNA